MKNTVSWDMTPCSLVNVCQRSGVTCFSPQHAAASCFEKRKNSTGLNGVMFQKTVLSFIKKGRAMARAPNGHLATVVIHDKQWHSVDEDRTDSMV